MTVGGGPANWVPTPCQTLPLLSAWPMRELAAPANGSKLGNAEAWFSTWSNKTLSGRAFTEELHSNTRRTQNEIFKTRGFHIPHNSAMPVWRRPLGASQFLEGSVAA